MRTVYVSDLDGTLLGPDAQLSDFSRRTLEEMLKAGLVFTVASARSVYSMRANLAGLSLSLPAVEFNGAFISDLPSGRHHAIHSIEPEIAEELYRLIRGHGSVPFISSFDGSEDRACYGEIVNEGMQWFLDDRKRVNDPRLRFVPDLAQTLRDPIVCLTVIGQENVLQGLKSAIVERHSQSVWVHFYENQYSPGWHWLTVHPFQATKDRAIREVLETCGLNPCELVVFGDHDNDLEMFDMAHRAIAVANATENLKRRATQVIGPNCEDSVVRFIREDWVRDE